MSFLGRTIRCFVCGLLLVQAVPALSRDVWAPQKPQMTPETIQKAVSTYPALRTELLTLISKAQHRVWLFTDYLTDGEIASALFLAKYRNVDVQVILGREKANAYLSRLHTLRKNDTPVFSPAEFRLGHPSGLLVDEQLYVIDSELDFRAKNTSFALLAARPTDTETFAQRFAVVTGRPPELNRAIWSKARSNKPSTSNPEYQGEKNGVYNYNKSTTVNELRPNIPKALPRQPKFKATPPPPPPAGTGNSGSGGSVWK